jgi:hypothetical protein
VNKRSHEAFFPQGLTQEEAGRRMEQYALTPGLDLKNANGSGKEYFLDLPVKNLKPDFL